MKIVRMVGIALAAVSLFGCGSVSSTVSKVDGTLNEGADAASY